MVAVAVIIMMMTIPRIGDGKIRNDKDSSADHIDAGKKEEEEEEGEDGEVKLKCCGVRRKTNTAPSSALRETLPGPLYSSCSCSAWRAAQLRLGERSRERREKRENMMMSGLSSVVGSSSHCLL